MPVRENSSIPLCLGVLGSGDDTNAEDAHPPGVDGAETSLFFWPRQRMRLLVPPIPEGLQVQPPSATIHWPVMATDIDLSFFPRIFARGKKQRRGRGATHKLLGAAHGMYDAAVTSLPQPHHITHNRQ